MGSLKLEKSKLKFRDELAKKKKNVATVGDKTGLELSRISM